MTETHREHQYLGIMGSILNFGDLREDRTGTGTLSRFGAQMRFDLQAGFPLLTTKKLHWKSIVVELLWMLRGHTNTQWLNEQGVTIWDEWAGVTGDLGPVYGYQWRMFGDSGVMNGFEGVDQIKEVIESIKTNPNSRRHIVSAWNPVDVPYMALPPCHVLFQFYVSQGRLSCHLYQRSADWFLGVPFNIASYALLTHIIARECGLQVGEFVHSFGDYHLYTNHIEQAKLQLTREPRPFPQVMIRPGRGIFELEFEDFELLNYDPHPAIKAEVAV